MHLILPVEYFVDEPKSCFDGSPISSRNSIPLTREEILGEYRPTNYDSYCYLEKRDMSGRVIETMDMYCSIKNRYTYDGEGRLVSISDSRFVLFIGYDPIRYKLVDSFTLEEKSGLGIFKNYELKSVQHLDELLTDMPTEIRNENIFGYNAKKFLRRK